MVSQRYVGRGETLEQALGQADTLARQAGLETDKRKLSYVRLTIDHQGDLYTVQGNDFDNAYDAAVKKAGLEGTETKPSITDITVEAKGYYSPKKTERSQPKPSGAAPSSDRQTAKVSDLL